MLMSIGKMEKRICVHVLFDPVAKKESTPNWLWWGARFFSDIEAEIGKIRSAAQRLHYQDILFVNLAEYGRRKGIFVFMMG